MGDLKSNTYIVNIYEATLMITQGIVHLRDEGAPWRAGLDLAWRAIAPRVACIPPRVRTFTPYTISLGNIVYCA
jgi:hypothetical protein